MRPFNRPLIAVIALLCILSCCNADTIKDGGHHDPSQSPDVLVLLPDWLGNGFSVSSTDHFCVAHDSGMPQARQLADRLEEAFLQFQSFFEQSGFELQSPPMRLSWISFSDQDLFAQYVRRAEKTDVSRLSGYYSAKTNRVVIVESASPDRLAAEQTAPVQIAGDVLGDIAPKTVTNDPNQFVKIAHELAHQLAFNTGLQKRGVMYPLWVSEGLAMQYETKLTLPHRGNTDRSDRLVEMQIHNRLIPLERFASITRLPANRDYCEDLYAQAWGFFDFLLTRHPDVLQNYLKSLYNGKVGFRSVSTVEREFSAYFGSIDDLNSQWAHYICTR